MKIKDAVMFTDNKTIRLECGDKNYYITEDKKIYTMHPINVMAEEVKGGELKEIKDVAKKGGFKLDKEVKKWL